MFELRVQPDEHVIDQGDDGDNFYVIERCVRLLKAQDEGASVLLCLAPNKSE